MTDAPPAPAASVNAHANGTGNGAATCPKCGHRRRTAGEVACARCGLTFAHWTPEQAAQVPQLDERAEALWSTLDSAWADETRHDAFLKYCSAAGLLGPAGRRYRERLAHHPGDPLATRMQERIVAMATVGFARTSPRPQPVTRSGWFWALLLGCGAIGTAAALLLGNR